MKKLIVLSLLLAAMLPAQTIGIQIPTSVFQSRSWHNIKWFAVSNGILHAVNLADYYTSRRALFPGQIGYGHFCENNDLLTVAPCELNVQRFTGTKIGVEAFADVEWLPIILNKIPPHYTFIMTTVNVTGSAVLGFAVGGNIHALVSHPAIGLF